MTARDSVLVAPHETGYLLSSNFGINEQSVLIYGKVLTAENRMESISAITSK